MPAKKVGDRQPQARTGELDEHVSDAMGCRYSELLIEAVEAWLSSRDSIELRATVESRLSRFERYLDARLRQQELYRRQLVCIIRHQLLGAAEQP